MLVRKSLLISVFFAFVATTFSPHAHAEVHAKLQWFDSRGEIMDLDWPTTIQWVWAQEKTPDSSEVYELGAGPRRQVFESYSRGRDGRSSEDDQASKNGSK